MKYNIQNIKYLHFGKLFLLFTIFLLLKNQAFSQSVSASFSCSTTSGCEPLLVNFTNTSTAGTTSVWNFGNGNSSTVTNPGAIYTSGGNYTVTLTVSNGVTSASCSQIITVYFTPTANFTSYDHQGCVPLLVTFNDISIPGSGSIVNRIWDFGDGSNYIGTNNNVNHTYFGSGYFPVSLQVINSFGCSDIKFVSNYVFTDQPLANFGVDTNNYCSVPANVQFFNISSGVGNLSYLWNFGDGFTSSQATPNHIYTNFGSYNISLTITDDLGCSNSLTLSGLVNIQPIVAQFSFSTNSVCVGDTIDVTNQTVGANMFTWTFGNQTSNLQTPENISFQTGGNYTVTLLTSLYGACQDQVSHSIFVESVIANYSVDPTYICELPGAVQYTNLSTTNSPAGINGCQFIWTLANGDSTGIFDPDILLTDYDMDYQQQIYLDDELTVVSPNGCESTIHFDNHIYIAIPSCVFIYNPLMGCVPLTIHFSNLSSFNNDVNDGISSYSWTFGDGGTSTATNPQHTYTTSGIFQTILTLTTDSGCQRSASVTIKVGEPQTAGFYIANPQPMCASDTIVIVDQSSDINMIDYYYFGTFGGPGSYVDTFFVQAADTGFMDITLIVGNLGCFDTITVQNAVELLAPVSYFTVSHECEFPYTFTFWGAIIGADYYVWDFDDGNYNYVDTTFDYTFSAEGEYHVTLHSDNYSTGCEYNLGAFIHVFEVESFFTVSDSMICAGDSVSFNPIDDLHLGLIYYADTFGLYRWNFDDGLEYFYPDAGFMTDTMTTILPLDTIVHRFNLPGIYNCRLIVSDVYGCLDTFYREIRVFQPNTEIVLNPPHGCPPFLTNLSISPIQDTTITSYYWNFFDTFTTDSSNIDYTFPNAGEYYIYVTITDTLGCVASNIDTINVAAPVPSFTCENPNSCVGSQITFSSTYDENSATYVWNFGDLCIQSIFGNNTITHAYQYDGNFNVTLTIIDYGCQASNTVMQMVNIQDPAVDIIASQTDSTCYPLLVNFDYAPHQNNISMLWIFGDGGLSQLINPVHTYTSPGDYYLQLFVTTSNGCTHHIDSFLIDIDGPYAEFNIEPNLICLGDIVNLHFTNAMNVESFIIDFGDGNLLQDVADIAHPYTHASTENVIYPIAIFWAPDSSCVIFDIDTIVVFDVRALFDRGTDDLDTAACYSNTVTFYNHAVNADEWLWDFGDGTTSGDANPIHAFNEPGTYDVSLSVESYFLGCRVTETKKIYIYPNPQITVTQSPEICLDSSVVLQATGGIDYIWTPSDGLSDTQVSNPIASPDVSTLYAVVVTDDKGCQNTGHVDLFVQTMPNVPADDTLIVIGEIVNIPGNGHYNVIYDWTPDIYISCSNCYNPVFQPLETTTYYCTATAYAGDKICYVLHDTITISIKKEYTIDMPTVFTPNGDNRNDILYVRGWGLKTLLEYKIFNRWGEMIYSGTDLHQGWDGTFNGIQQAIDSYTYLVKAETYENKVLTINGIVTLLR